MVTNGGRSKLPLIASRILAMASSSLESWVHTDRISSCCLTLTTTPQTCAARRGVRIAPESNKKPPTTSSDGGDARRWRQNNGTPRRTVVLPHPFAPTIIVNGDSNSMACSLSGEKARMPRMASFSI